MSETESIVVDTSTRILRDLCDPQALNSATDDRWVSPLWSALEQAGLTRAWVSEKLGGAGASVTDGFDVLRVAGTFAVPIPLAETLIAGWLLAKAEISVPEGPMAVAPVCAGERLQLEDGKLRGRATRVPFAHDVERIALIARRDGEPVIALVDRAACSLSDDVGAAGQPRGHIGFDGVSPSELREAPAQLDEQALMLMGAAVRATQMAGALQSVLEISVKHANDRIAFERPIGKFQAVQHSLARLAGEAAAAVAATGSAADAVQNASSFDEAVFLEIASAKIRVGEAVGEGAAIAHQVHGAIGFTREHVLHRFTTRMWAWRDDFGSESDWAVRLGNAVAARGADALWPMIAAR